MSSTDVLISVLSTRSNSLLHKFTGHKWSCWFLLSVSPCLSPSESIHTYGLCRDFKVYFSPCQLWWNEKIPKTHKKGSPLFVLLCRNKLSLRLLYFLFLKLKRYFSSLFIISITGLFGFFLNTKCSVNDCSKNIILKLNKTIKFKCIFDTVVELHFMNFLEMQDVCLRFLPQLHILIIINFFSGFIVIHACSVGQFKRWFCHWSARECMKRKNLKILVSVV